MERSLDSLEEGKFGETELPEYFRKSREMRK